MAISTTIINGTDSVAASRITLNDNFNTVVDALNSVLSIIDIATGKINNYAYGSNNDIETEDLTVRGGSFGINVISGNVAVGSGNIIIGGTSGNGILQIGAGSNSIKLEKITKNSQSVPSTNFPTINLSGSAATGGTGTPFYVSIPRMDLVSIKDISQPAIGSLVAIVNAGGTGIGALALCTASGPTGTWINVVTGTGL